MGKGRDKKKKNRASGGVKKSAHNQGRREELNEQKRERREERKAKGGEDDIQALLAQVALQDKKVKECQILENVPPPSPRCNCTFTALANHVLAGSSGAGAANKHKSSNILLYGGEYFDGRKTFVYGDLFKYDAKKGTWSQIITTKPPKPRSGHQSFAYRGKAKAHSRINWYDSYSSLGKTNISFGFCFSSLSFSSSPSSSSSSFLLLGYFYTFGGEYTSPNQKNFNHYRDLWRMDLETFQWEKLSLKGGPSARSGHRMVQVKGKAIMFGGFYDTGRELKYYSDLWIFDIGNLKWSTHGLPGQHSPSARSGFQFFADEEQNKVFLYGGYSKKVDDRGDEHGVTHDDLWCLDLNTLQWEKIKKSGIFPVKRAGSSIVTHKKSAVVFGGVVDHEVEDGEVMLSEFFNDLHSFRMDTRRWFPMTVCPPGSKTRTMGTISVVKRGSIEEKAAIKIQANFRGFMVKKAYKSYSIGKSINELIYSPAVLKQAGGKVIHPCPRIKGNVVVIDNTLWMYGGTYEDKDKEVTLDDLWSINLNKLDGWREIYKGTFAEQVSCFYQYLSPFFLSPFFLFFFSFIFLVTKQASVFFVWLLSCS